jgi:hypothetical protein
MNTRQTNKHTKKIGIWKINRRNLYVGTNAGVVRRTATQKKLSLA